MKTLKKTKDELMKLCIMNNINTERLAVGYIPYKIKYYDKKHNIIDAEYWAIIYYNIDEVEYNIDQIVNEDITKLTKGRRVLDVVEQSQVDYVIPNTEHSLFNIVVTVDKLLDLNYVDNK